MQDDAILIEVGALIEDERGRILLVRHMPEPGGDQWEGWVLPGGMLAVGETVDECIIRHVREKTGLIVEIISDIVHHIERIDREGPHVELHVVYIVKRAQVAEDALRPENEVGWIWWAGDDETFNASDRLDPDMLRLIELFSRRDN